MAKSEHISNTVIRRLPRYYRFLGELSKEGITKISSRQLSERMKITASQIRQDLNCFGGFGQQGYGYNVAELRNEIAKIIGVDNQLNTILIGAGKLGSAIAEHLNFEKCGCKLTGIFDISPDVIGKEINGIKITNMSSLVQFCSETKPKIAVLCVPKEVAKSVCADLIANGIHSFWNFSHYDIAIEYDNINVENVHLGDSLLTLAYSANNNSQE